MAHFAQHATSPDRWIAAGEWSEVAVGPTLLVRWGENPVFVLWGGADDGARLEVKAIDSGNIGYHIAEDDRIPTGPNERAFWFTPKTPGEVLVNALHPKTNQPYAAPLRIVILPRDASAGTEEFVLVYGNDAHKSDDMVRKAKEAWRLKDGFTGTIFGFKSPNEFLAMLCLFRDTGRTIKRLEVISHAHINRVTLGSHAISDTVLRSWGGRAVHKAFAKDADINFHGCLIAYGKDGEAFLEACAELFLKEGGGRVAAASDLGYGARGWPLDPANIWHLKAFIKRVHVDQSGHIVKRDNFGKDPHRIFGPDSRI